MRKGGIEGSGGRKRDGWRKGEGRRGGCRKGRRDEGRDGGMEGGREGEVGCPRRRHVMPSPPRALRFLPGAEHPRGRRSSARGAGECGAGRCWDPIPCLGQAAPPGEGGSTVLEVASWQGSRIGCKNLEVQTGEVGARGVWEVPPGCAEPQCLGHIYLYFLISSLEVRAGCAPVAPPGGHR